jgi:hypothetical protein
MQPGQSTQCDVIAQVCMHCEQSEEKMIWYMDVPEVLRSAACGVYDFNVRQLRPRCRREQAVPKVQRSVVPLHATQRRVEARSGESAASPPSVK